MKKIYLFLSFFYLSMEAYGNYDDYYYELMRVSPYELVAGRENYLKDAETDEEKLYIHYYVAFAYYYLKDKDRAVIGLKQMEGMLKNLDSNYAKAVIGTKIAVLYAHCDYPYKSKIAFSESRVIIDSIRDPDQQYLALAHFYFQQALVSRNSDEGIECYELSEQYLAKVSEKLLHKEMPKLPYKISVNLGDAYFSAGRLDDAEQYTRNALLRKSFKGRYAGVPLFNMGLIKLGRKDDDSALYFLEKSLPYLRDDFDNGNLLVVIDSISAIYKRRGDKANQERYARIRSEVEQRFGNVENKAISLKTENEIRNTAHPWSTGILIGGLVIILSITVYYFSFVKKRKAAHPDKRPAVSKNDTRVRLNISPEYESEILERLDLFEKNLSFLNPSISLAKFTAELNSNGPYVSEIIHKNKKMNFNQYILTLRINYIIDKLKNSKQYRAYKIAILASECGFTSHSSFTRAFKQIKGISPTEYIERIKAGTDS